MDINISESMDCDKCHGIGLVKVNKKIETCPKCNGDGTLDWIENATGKTNDKCDSSIYENGKHVGIFDSRFLIMESLMKELKKEGFNKVDWHYVGGRAVVKTLDDPEQVLERLESLIPRRLH